MYLHKQREIKQKDSSFKQVSMKMMKSILAKKQPLDIQKYASGDKLDLWINLDNVYETAFRDVQVFKTDQVVDALQIKNQCILDQTKKFTFVSSCPVNKSQIVLLDPKKVLNNIIAREHLIDKIRFITLLQYVSENMSPNEDNNRIKTVELFCTTISKKYTLTDPQRHQFFMIQVAGLCPNGDNTKALLYQIQTLINKNDPICAQEIQV